MDAHYWTTVRPYQSETVCKACAGAVERLPHAPLWTCGRCGAITHYSEAMPKGLQRPHFR